MTFLLKYNKSNKKPKWSVKLCINGNWKQAGRSAYNKVTIFLLLLYGSVLFEFFKERILGQIEKVDKWPSCSWSSFIPQWFTYIDWLHHLLIHSPLTHSLSCFYSLSYSLSLSFILPLSHPLIFSSIHSSINLF